MTLTDLTSLLDRYAAGELSLAALQEQFAVVLAADPLDVEESDATPWNDGHEETRLCWRLIYRFDTETEDDEAARRLAGRVVRCLARTADAGTTYELLPILVDQERLCAIVRKHRAGIISRTGFLNVLAASGYPSHVKLWLQHAPPDALDRLCAMLDAEAYHLVATSFERPPR